MNKDNDSGPQGRYSQNTIKVILDSISESQIAYDRTKKTIDFDVAVRGLKSKTYDDLLCILANFGDLKQLKETVSEATIIASTLETCYDTIERLKYIPRYGETYYKIINDYCIKKIYTSVDDAAEALGISRRTFYRRKDTAFEKLHVIWFQINPTYMHSVFGEIYKQLSLWRSGLNGHLCLFKPLFF